MTVQPKPECEQRERIIQIEKDLSEVKTTNQFQNQQLEKLQNALEETTRALNKLSNLISEQEASHETNKWFIAIGLTIAGLVIGRFL